MTRNIRLTMRSVRRLLPDRRGNAMVEFALIGPTMLLVMVAVVQVGLHIQNYNAVRNLAADGSRFAVVQYQNGTKSPAAAIETWIRAKAVSGVYNLDTNRLEVVVTPAAASRLAGMTEMEIAVSYAAPDYLWSTAANSLNINYTRPVFLPI